MARTTRTDVWHEAYHAIFEQISRKDPEKNPNGNPRIFLTKDEVASCMGISKREVCRVYPEGWRNCGDGRGRGKVIRLDTLLDQEFKTY